MTIDHEAVRTKTHELADLLGMGREELAAQMLDLVTKFEADGAGRTFTTFAADRAVQMARELR